MRATLTTEGVQLLKDIVPSLKESLSTGSADSAVNTVYIDIMTNSATGAELEEYILMLSRSGGRSFGS